ncbi:hypothetical protein MMC19_000351 [Ptychographa xylographoides]|nr:hypothetical protein [Ptychographa xylographoides]
MNEIMITADDGTDVIFDTSDQSKIAMTVPGKYSVIIDASNIYFYLEDCSAELIIWGGGAVLAANSSSPSPARFRSRSSSLQDRGGLSPFTVDLLAQDQCGNPDDVGPTMTCGINVCSVVSDGSGSGSYTGTCVFPNAQAACAPVIQGYIDWATGGIQGSTTNWKDILIKLNTFFAKGGPAWLGIGGLAFILEAPYIGSFLLAYGAFQSGMAIVGNEVAAINICGVMHYEYAVQITVNYWGQSTSVALLEYPPSGPLAATVYVNDPKIGTCANGCNGGSCGAYSGCDDTGSCICGNDIHGTSACFVNALCSAVVPCATNTDCGGGVCLASNCCGFSACAARCNNAPVPSPTPTPGDPTFPPQRRNVMNGTALSLAGPMGMFKW